MHRADCSLSAGASTPLRVCVSRARGCTTYPVNCHLPPVRYREGGVTHAWREEEKLYEDLTKYFVQ